MRQISYHKSVFRNFATIIPSQNLTDDLSHSPRGQKILQNFFYSPSETTRKSPIERVLEKSERMIVQAEIASKFNPENWYASRYSDGTWPVIYTAESQETALHEAIHHMRRFYREELHEKEVIVDRRVVRLRLGSRKGFDLTGDRRLDRRKLTSGDEGGYPYCRQLAKKARQAGGELMRAPSARHKGGVCVPVFVREAVKKDEGHLKYLKILLSEKECHVFVETEVQYLTDTQAKRFWNSVKKTRE